MSKPTLYNGPGREVIDVGVGYEPVREDSDPRKKLKKHQYWLPDLIEVEPMFKVKANPRRKSRFAADYERQENGDEQHGVLGRDQHGDG